MPLPASQTKLSILRHRADFLAVAAYGKKWVTPGLIVQIKPHVPLELGAKSKPIPIGYGLTASKKVGNAVKRNRARRRLRALACEFLPSHAKPGNDYVLIARDVTVTREHADLKKDLLWALRKLGA